MPFSNLIAKRYASALFDLSSEDNCVDAVDADFSSLIEMIESCVGLKSVITIPTIDSDQQKNALIRIAHKSKLHKHVCSLLLLLARKRRMLIISDIYDEFCDLLRKQRNEIKALVISSRELEKGESSTIEKLLMKHFCADSIILEQTVDNSLWGGSVVEVKGMRIDTSVRGRLRRIEKQLKQTNLEEGNFDNVT